MANKNLFSILEPHTLSLITTDKCSSACKNCCFQCNMSKSNMMTFEEMKLYIDEVRSNFHSISTCVFTGGECSLLGDNLFDIVCYASEASLRCRIVTNAVWATSEKAAFVFLQKLKKSGLKELNISTGDEHQKWVDYNNIVYACQAAVSLDLLVVLTIESTPHSTFTSRSVREDIRLSDFIKTNRLKIKDSMWIEFDKSEANLYRPNILNNEACTNLFTTVTISPSGNLLACCGLTCNGSRYLNLGNIGEHSIRTLYEEQFDDLVKLWLYTHGPAKIQSFICKKKRMKDDSFRYPHICSLCHHVLSAEGNMELIKRNINEILPTVLLRYTLLNKIKE